jgi:hypothetical protein
MGHDSVRAAMIYQHGTAEADRKIADSMNDKIMQSQKIKKPKRERDRKDGDDPPGVLAPTG